MSAYETLISLYHSDTLADDIGKDARQMLSAKILRDFEEDKESMRDILAKMDQAIEITNLYKQPRHRPFTNSSNIKFPLVTTACINFASRGQFETIKNGEPLHYKLWGTDDSGMYERLAKRKKAYMNWQLMEDMPYWMDEREALFYIVSVTGTCFTKTYYDPIKKKKCTRLLKYDRLIVNNSIQDLESAPRISEIKYLTPTELKRAINSRFFRKVDVSQLRLDMDDHRAIHHELIEHHCWVDLDGDDVEEPWVVIIHKASGEILKIMPGFELDKIDYDKSIDVIRSIEREKYYTVYRMLHDPAMGFFGMGYGTLLGDCNESVNTLFNQLVDSGSLANYQGGFIGSDLRIRKKRIEAELGEWLTVDSDGADIKDNIVPFNYKEPSAQLFSLLTYLVDAVNKMTSVTDALTGTANTTDTSPNVLQMLIQQGLKVYGAVMRRLFRSMRDEIAILDRLNTLYPDIETYLQITAPRKEEMAEMIGPDGQFLDFLPSRVKIVPVIDVNQSTEAETMVKSQVLQQGAVQFEQMRPGTMNMKNVARRWLSQIEIPKVEELIAPDPPPGPNIPLIELQSKLDQVAKNLEFKDREVKIKEKELALDAFERGVKMKEILARSVKLLADASAVEHGKGLDQYKAELQRLSLMIDAETKIKKNQERDPGEAMPHPNAAMVKQEAMRRGWLPPNGA